VAAVSGKKKGGASAAGPAYPGAPAAVRVGERLVVRARARGAAPGSRDDILYVMTTEIFRN